MAEARPMLWVQHVEFHSEPIERCCWSDAESSPRCVQSDLCRRGQQVAGDRDASRVMPLQVAYGEHQLVALFGLLEPATHEIELLIYVLDLLPPAHSLRPWLPLLDEVLEPVLLD